MGLLDDAIREHLELKHRHGADSAEVEKLEHEAFGPIRGGEAAAPLVHDDADYDDEPAFEDDDHDVAALTDAPEPAPPAPIESEPVARIAPEPAAPPPPPDEPEPGPFALDPLPPALDPLPVPDPEPAPVEDDSQSTIAFTLDEAQDAEVPPATMPHPVVEQPVDPDVVAADEEAHDELEETPDFLEETPEHDRLWFEQKPPRDFDF